MNLIMMMIWKKGNNSIGLVIITVYNHCTCVNIEPIEDIITLEVFYN